MQFLITFIALSIVNVIFATIKSIATIKSGKIIASITSGGYFAFYNIMLIYTVADFPMWQKCTITFICNVIGVFLVKFGEEKMQKDKLWKVEATVPTSARDRLDLMLSNTGFSYNYIDSKEDTIFNIFCPTKKQSHALREILTAYNAKFFVSESKNL